ncbi:protein GL2-INTERACTING REPRESSOR 1-like [Phragmites australis]|uniref:protein GL2-INTERACTING REPRESSOR 1-like n=1 Tax=Phragmites australis TaxID=29695 RepID=UPI002D798DE1|nr:protein GL2-INTERACTING REPRESSOR 1-like [Phragmites australis]XP_062223164.1 protein GL2-INTERACTING REPRESSOR 1-like [Phragmites australis]
MSRGSGGRDLDLKLNLNLSPPAARGRVVSLDEESSSPSSCLSSEGEREHHEHGLQWSDSPEATSMVLAACPRCLMYVMLSEADPRCPRCRSPVLLDFLDHAAGTGNNSNFNGGNDGNNLSRSSGRGSRRNRRA